MLTMTFNPLLGVLFIYGTVGIPVEVHDYPARGHKTHPTHGLFAVTGDSQKLHSCDQVPGDSTGFQDQNTQQGHPTHLNIGDTGERSDVMSEVDHESETGGSAGITEVDHDSANAGSGVMSEIDHESPTGGSAGITEVDHESETGGSGGITEIDHESETGGSGGMSEIDHESETGGSAGITELDHDSANAGSGVMSEIDHESETGGSAGITEIDHESETGGSGGMSEFDHESENGGGDSENERGSGLNGSPGKVGGDSNNQEDGVKGGSQPHQFIPSSFFLFAHLPIFLPVQRHVVIPEEHHSVVSGQKGPADRKSTFSDRKHSAEDTPTVNGEESTAGNLAGGRRKGSLHVLPHPVVVPGSGQKGQAQGGLAYHGSFGIFGLYRLGSF